MTFRRLLAGILLASFVAIGAHAASLLPNGRQVFLDANGRPLANGTVTFYIPNTSSLKNTWQDPGQSALNTNPVVLDAAGSATIYGAGAYRQVVKSAAGVVVWDKLTADTASALSSFGGTSGGTSNLQTISAPNFTSSNGQSITFVAGLTNTGPMALNVNGAGGISIVNDTPAGPVALKAGDIVAGNVVQVVYSSTGGVFHTAIAPSGLPVGTISEYAGSVAPSGYLMAYGQCVSRTTFAALYSVVGTTYGACDGSTTFAVPDKRGRVAVGNDSMGGVASGRISSIPALANLGGSGGEQQHTLTMAELPASGVPGSVTVSYPAHTYQVVNGSAGSGGSAPFVFTGTTPASTVPPAPQAFSFTTSNLGSGTAHNVVQPSIALNFIIKI